MATAQAGVFGGLSCDLFILQTKKPDEEPHSGYLFAFGGLSCDLFILQTKKPDEEPHSGYLFAFTHP